MKRTVKLCKPERCYGGWRDEVTVEPYGTTFDYGRERTVWADVDDDSALYTLQCGLLWRFDGYLA